jgi:nitroreductase
MNPDLIHFLNTRRSTKLTHFDLDHAAPDADEIQQILSLATRVPDHGRKAPWYFMVFEGENRIHAGDLLKQAYAQDYPEDASPEKLEFESERFTKAPVVIAVISRIKNGKIPVWEQILSAGAVCYNLCIAANSFGYGTNWLTHWYAYSPTFKNLLGLDGRDHIAGFIYMGKVLDTQEERERPNIDAITNFWTPALPALNKESEDTSDQDVPVMGFGF